MYEIFLVASTTGDWTKGSKLYEFDKGIDKIYGERKKVAFDYLEETFGDRFHVEIGNSENTVKKMKEKNSEWMCDIVHIDGDHEPIGLRADILNMHEIAHEETLLFLDDLNYRFVPDVVKEFEDKKIIEVLHRYQQSSVSEDWMIDSGWQPVKNRGKRQEKIYAVGRFLYT